MPTYTTLIEPEELAAPLARHGSATSDWAVLDCRFDLARPEWGASAYAAGHIPGALYAHLDRDLSGPVSAQTGRHPLPAPEQLARTLTRWGVDSSVQVVAYDQGNGAYAARLWWLLRWAGHAKVAVLNGGFAAWQQAGLPVDTVPGERSARDFRWRAPRGQAGDGSTPAQEPAPDAVSTAELERIVAAGELQTSWPMGPPGGPMEPPDRPMDRAGKLMLVDARGADRFAGQNETIDPVAGHIPGARNHPFTGNLDAQGRFLPPEELRRRWEATLGGATGVQSRAAQVIAMCGSGVTACHNLLALEIAGLPGARLYAGSWSEWIRDPQRPVERSAPQSR
jgi:thiosulfate/3-mercaptopyruvate sulfurtransferase